MPLGHSTHQMNAKKSKKLDDLQMKNGKLQNILLDECLTCNFNVSNKLSPKQTDYIVHVTFWEVLVNLDHSQYDTWSFATKIN